MPFRKLVFLSLLFTGCLGFAAPPASPSRNIVLITLDTTRADRMGFLGSKLGLTPHLDALAADSAVFTRAYSQVPITTASHATILTGTYPQFHKVNDAGVPLAASVPFAPAILKAYGYQTAAFVGCVILDPKAGGAPGFQRGFDTYDAGFRSRGPGEDRYSTLERRAADVVAHAIKWLDQHPKGPFFLWVHLYDPHAPYEPPEPFRSRFPSSPYDGEIAYADSAVGQLLDHLRAKSLYDNSVIAVMADHGEAFGEHGERGHGVFLYDPTIHVPLLIKPAGAHPQATKHDQRAQLVDVLPTLLQLAGKRVPAGLQGKPLPVAAASKEASSEPDRPAYAETDYPRRAYGWSSLRSLRTGKYLYIEAPRPELYDQQSDGAEAHNLAPASSAVASTLQSQLESLRRQTASARTAPKANLDPEQEAKLRALGYVASAAPNNAGGDIGGPDPKDKIEVANQMAEASLALEDGRPREAILRLQGVVAKDSTVSSAYSTLGSALLAQGDLQQAIPALRKAVELRSDSVMAHYQLAMALFQAGDLQAAAPEFEAAVSRNPRSADMHFSLASVYVRVNRMDDAKKELETALRLKPDLFQANMMMGQVLVLEKKGAAALPYLQKAQRAQPNLADVHSLLAEAYTLAGDKRRAAEERKLADELSRNRTRSR